MREAAGPIPGSCWVGRGEPPFPVEHRLPDLDGPLPQPASVVFVEGAARPDGELSRRIDEWLGGRLVPWIAIVDDPASSPSWLEAGAWSVLPAYLAVASALRLGRNILRRTGDAGSASPLTGLPGNTAIMRRLEEDVLDGDCTAAYVDITGFKPFNDYYGFARGDAVIRSLSQSLTGCLGGRFFSGHLGGDDFVCVGRGREFRSALDQAVNGFRARVPMFYDDSDRAAGGIEALDRYGEFRFFPLLDLTVAMVGASSPGETLEDLASRAAALKRQIKGELPEIVPSSFLSDPGGAADGGSFLGWYTSCPAGEKPDTRDGKALLEAAGMAGDRGVTACLCDVLLSSLVPDLRKSAAFSLGRMQDPASLDSLRRALTDPSPHVRTRAVEALAATGGPRAGPEVAGMAGDRSTWVRRASLRGIGVSGWRKGLGILCSSLETGWRKGRDGRDTVMERKAALEGIMLLGDPAASVLLGRLWNTKGYSPRRELLEALYSTGTDLAVNTAAAQVSAHGPRLAGTLGRLQFTNACEEAVRILERAVVSALTGSGGSDRELLDLLARFPVPLSRETLSALKSLIGRAGEPGALVATLLAVGDIPVNSSVSRAVTRMTGGEGAGDRDLIALIAWSSRGRGVRPGLLLPFLRHPSREVSTSAARAVLVLARRWKSPEFDRDGESLNI